MGELNVVVIGYGYWGPKLVRNFTHSECWKRVDICELDPKRAAQGLREWPGATLYRNFDQVTADPSVHAVAIATPVSTHYPLAKKALSAGKHVLLEKPIALSLQEAQELNELAQKKKLTLLVDHTFIYHPAVQKIKEIIAQKQIGRIRYIDATRINLGLIQHDVNVLWDLAVHDLAIVQYLTEEEPESVQALGASQSAERHEDIAFLTLRYASGLFVHINSSWISPLKLRHMLIGGDQKMIVYNDMNAGEPVKVYDCNVVEKSDDEDKIKRFHYEYRVGDVYSPRIQQIEALSLVIKDFSRAILDKSKPLSDALFSIRVTKILEAAQKSIHKQGIPIYLRDEPASLVAP